MVVDPSSTYNFEAAAAAAKIKMQDLNIRSLQQKIFAKIAIIFRSIVS
jgi:hypothetical protein